MSLTKEHIQQQCKRLAAVPALAPQSAEGKREVVDALLRHCQSNEHVTRTITNFLEQARDCHNIVAELISIASGCTDKAQLPAGCDACYIGPDAYSGEVRWASHVTVDRGNYTAAERCSCPRGQWLAARDRERWHAPEKSAPRTMRPITDFARRAAGDNAE